MVANKSFRNWLTATWFGFCLIDLIIILGLYASDWIGDQSLEFFLKSINRLFIPYLGTVLAYHLSTRANAVERERQAELGSFIVAISATVLWNGVILFFFTSCGFSKVIGGSHGSSY